MCNAVKNKILGYNKSFLTRRHYKNGNSRSPFYLDLFMTFLTYQNILFCFSFLISQNITGVVAAISNLLSVKIPSSYEVSSTPDRGPLSALGGQRVVPHGMESRAPMLFHGQEDNGGLHGRMGLIRSGGGQAMMQYQQTHNFRFHLNSPGKRISYIKQELSELKFSLRLQLEF